MSPTARGAAAEVSPTTGVAPQRIGGVESKPIADMEAEMRHALEQREKEATLLKQDKAQKESAKAAKKQEKLHKLAVAQAKRELQESGQAKRGLQDASSAAGSCASRRRLRSLHTPPEAKTT